MLNFFILILLGSGFVYSSSSFSLKLNGYENIFHKYSNEGKWYVDHLLVDEDNFQDLVKSEVFKSEKESEQRIRELRKHYLKNRPYYKKIRNPFFKKSRKVQKPVWEVKNSWSLVWEDKFEQWIIDNFTSDFFVKHSLPVDCADVAYALRWIFSRNNGLPMVATLYGSKIIFSQDNVRSSWKKLKRSKNWHDDKLFMASLKYLLANTYTGTLKIDTFPVAINRTDFKVGTIHLKKSHTMIFDNFKKLPQKPISLLWSTLPIAARKLRRTLFFDKSPIREHQGGLVSIRWPKKTAQGWSLIEKEKMPRFSLEQYSFEDDFSGMVSDRVGIQTDFVEIAKKSIETLREMLESRVEVVKEAYNFCRSNNCSFMSHNYDLYSTPSRDKRIANFYKKTVKFFRDNYPVSGASRKAYALLEDLLVKEKIKIAGKELSLGQWGRIFVDRRISGDPARSLEERWGIGFLNQFRGMKSELDKSLVYRKKLIENNTCAKESCLYMSENWKRNSTGSFDQRLKFLYIALVKLCSENKKTCSVDKITQKYKDILFYSSNPLSSKNERYGKHIDSSEYILLPDTDEVKKIYGDFFMSKQLDSESGTTLVTRVINKTTKQVWTYQGDLQFHLFKKDQEQLSYALLKSGKKVLLIDHINNSVKEVTINSNRVAQKIVMLSSDLLLVEDKREIAAQRIPMILYSLNGNSFEFTHSEPSMTYILSWGTHFESGTLRAGSSDLSKHYWVFYTSDGLHRIDAYGGESIIHRFHDRVLFRDGSKLYYYNLVTRKKEDLDFTLNDYSNNTNALLLTHKNDPSLSGLYIYGDESLLLYSRGVESHRFASWAPLIRKASNGELLSFIKGHGSFDITTYYYRTASGTHKLDDNINIQVLLRDSLVYRVGEDTYSMDLLNGRSQKLNEDIRFCRADETSSLSAICRGARMFQKRNKVDQDKTLIDFYIVDKEGRDKKMLEMFLRSDIPESFLYEYEDHNLFSDSIEMRWDDTEDELIKLDKRFFIKFNVFSGS